MRSETSRSTGPSSRKLERTDHPGIYKRGGSYVVVYRDPQGRQKKKAARTLRQALDLKATLRADVVRGEYRAVSQTTFTDYAKVWIDTYRGRTSRGIRAKTLADYRRQLGLDVNGEPLGDGAVAFFGRKRLAEIEPSDVKRYAKQVADRGVSQNTVRLALAPVKALLADAFEEGVIRSNPAARVRIAQPAPLVEVDDDEEQQAKAWTREELRKLLDEVPANWRLLVELLAGAGLRVSEAIPLRWKDLDLGRRRVRVRRSMVDGVIGKPKTEYGRRDVPLSPALARRLWEERKRAGEGRDDALVFADRTGKAVAYNALRRALKKASERAGVPWLGVHALRHTAASLLFAEGWNAAQVQHFLGHHSAAFTLATYIHLLDHDLPEPLAVDSILDPEGGNAGATRGVETAGETAGDPVEQQDGETRLVPRIAAEA
ncbi:MAG: site-specific integrase [Thermoleophilia bacterium]|nr:site-specific integrase [Thermoleophilia bacterium]